MAIPGEEELARSIDSVIDLGETSYSDGPLVQASGRQHTLCVRDGGRAYAWGSSSLEDEGFVFVAHLGIGETWGDAISVPRPMLGVAARVVLVATGDLHSLVLCEGRRVYS